MSQPKFNNRRNALAQIHIAKKQLSMDDDSYRALLQQTAGKESCADMSIGELYQVIAQLEKCGFKKRRGRKTSGARRGQYSPKSKGQLVDVMRAIWIEMHRAGMIADGSEAALITWAKRQSSQLNGGVGVDSLEWLERDPTMASRVLESLKQWQRRLERRTALNDQSVLHNRQEPQHD